MSHFDSLGVGGLQEDISCQQQSSFMYTGWWSPVIYTKSSQSTKTAKLWPPCLSHHHEVLSHKNYAVDDHKCWH